MVVTPLIGTGSCAGWVQERMPTMAAEHSLHCASKRLHALAAPSRELSYGLCLGASGSACSRAHSIANTQDTSGQNVLTALADIKYIRRIRYWYGSVEVLNFEPRVWWDPAATSKYAINLLNSALLTLCDRMTGHDT